RIEDDAVADVEAAQGGEGAVTLAGADDGELVAVGGQEAAGDTDVEGAGQVGGPAGLYPAQLRRPRTGDGDVEGAAGALRESGIAGAERASRTDDQGAVIVEWPGDGNVPAVLEGETTPRGVGGEAGQRIAAQRIDDAGGRAVEEDGGGVGADGGAGEL